jgi:hypothetical protein
MEKNKIQFKPLHEGMGFHPFSDGLPYAPESKAKSAPAATGTGAVAAGRPRFQNPSAPLPRSGMKTARQLQQQEQAPRIVTPAPAPASTQARAQVSIEAPLRQRFFAYLLDTVLHAGFWIATNLAALFFFDFQLDVELVRENAGQFIAFFVVSQWIFVALQEVLFENSLGKSFFGLEFQGNHHSLFLRSTVFLLGILAGGLGLHYRPQDALGKIQLKRPDES